MDRLHQYFNSIERTVFYAILKVSEIILNLVEERRRGRWSVRRKRKEKEKSVLRWDGKTKRKNVYSASGIKRERMTWSGHEDLQRYYLVQLNIVQKGAKLNPTVNKRR